MKQHTTNYQNAFIEIAEDCPTAKGEIPPQKAIQTIASIQFEMISKNPYTYTSDDVIFHGYAVKHDLVASELEKARRTFFSKGQACLRSSPLTKRYGFGIHSNAEGKVALYGAETNEYKQLASDKTLNIVKAMRSKRG